MAVLSDLLIDVKSFKKGKASVNACRPQLQAKYCTEKFPAPKIGGLHPINKEPFYQLFSQKQLPPHKTIRHYGTQIIETSTSHTMQTSESNAVSISKTEFDETFATIKEILEHKGDPGEFMVEDPFLSSVPVKVDLRQHLQNLYNRMFEAQDSANSTSKVVTIDFS